MISFRIDDEKLLEQIGLRLKTYIELNNFLVYDDRYIKTKIKTYGGKVYTNFYDLNVPEDDIECEIFTVISIDFLLV